jgi:sec-independent protein translocase protein TatA
MIGDILQPTHLIFVLVVALLVLGPKRLPEAGRALGRGIRDFRTAISGEEDHHSELPTDAPAPAPAPEAMMTPTAATPYTSPAPYVETTDHTGTATPPVDHAIQAAVYAATPAEDATAEPPEAADHPTESAHSL